MNRILAVGLLLMTAFGAVAAELPVPGTRSSKPQCSWVSDCQTCRRGPGGRYVCSNPGIACQPKNYRCLRM